MKSEFHFYCLIGSLNSLLMRVALSRLFKINDTSFYTSLNSIARRMAKNSLMFSLSQCNNYKSRPLVKSVYQKDIFLISQPKHYVVGTQKNCLNETVPLSAPNIC